jgi:inhibitor-of-growth protein 1
VGDEKLQIVQTIQDLIENKARQLELDYRNLGEHVSFSDSERKYIKLFNWNSLSPL